jgi:3-oxoisoapionate decarboxylase
MARRTSMGLTPDSFPFRRIATAHELVEFTSQLGMGGCQVRLTTLEPAYARKLRERTEALGLYLAVHCGLPGSDASVFERTVNLAREAGAVALRVPSGGRRYEDFSSVAERQAHVARVRDQIRRAVPVVEAAKLPLGIENHKDWSLDEQVALLKEYSSEYLGACVDTGNNLALLDDPMEVVEALAPFAVTTHLKDMAVEEYPEGFLLAEVPLGEGFLDVARIITTLRRHRPRIHFSLEMITRDPLRIPCLTQKYWATFPETRAAHLARALAMVRVNKPKRPLPRVTGLDRDAALRLEMEHVERSITYARERLGLV